MHYYNKAIGTELFINPLVPIHLQYNASNPDHIELPDSNPYFSRVPEGYELQYGGDNIPTVLAEIPDYWLNKAKLEKTADVYNAFYNQAVAHGLPYIYEIVKQELDLRGMPPSPTADQTAVYANVGIADNAIAAIDALTTVPAVEAYNIGAIPWSA